MNRLIFFIIILSFISCEEKPSIETFTDIQYTILAYDQILINYNIDQQEKDSLYSILFNTFSVSRNELDSLKTILVEKSPYNPKILERVKAEIDSISRSESIYKIKSQ